ncbi:MAG: hypothetical protein WA116_08180 [Anaerolineaceae bacterium]
MTSSLQQGIDAAKSGLMEDALVHLKDAIVEEPENANVWVWLAAIIDDEEKQTIFLKKALEIDPGNRPAQRGLAFIERKKYIPPKPGEKLSDYTKPIGVFKSTPAQSESPVSVTDTAVQTEIPAETAAPAAAATTAGVAQPTSPTKHKAWLDVILYGITLMVFIVIGILIGTTLLNVELPFLAKPTPVLSVLPPSEGVFIQEGSDYVEMKISLNAPADESGIPATNQVKPSIVINTLMINLERVQLFDQDQTAVPYQTEPAENSINILTPEADLVPGRYCLVYTLNPEKNEALYWCLRVE